MSRKLSLSVRRGGPTGRPAESLMVAVRLSDVPAQARRLMGVIGSVRDLALGDPAAEAVAEGPRSVRTWPETSGACDA